MISSERKMRNEAIDLVKENTVTELALFLVSIEGQLPRRGF